MFWPFHSNYLSDRDVVFDEMANLYSPMNITEDEKAKNGDVLSNVEQKS